MHRVGHETYIKAAVAVTLLSGMGELAARQAEAASTSAAHGDNPVMTSGFLGQARGFLSGGSDGSKEGSVSDGAGALRRSLEDYSRDTSSTTITGGHAAVPAKRQPTMSGIAASVLAQKDLKATKGGPHAVHLERKLPQDQVALIGLTASRAEGRKPSARHLTRLDVEIHRAKSRGHVVAPVVGLSFLLSPKGWNVTTEHTDQNVTNPADAPTDIVEASRQNGKIFTYRLEPQADSVRPVNFESCGDREAVTKLFRRQQRAASAMVKDIIAGRAVTLPPQFACPTPR